ncbi:MAG: bifunctional 4-hydroxy-2-oxoglutarate aldolase/2-dehydro-3-deoxy-phosphogluconate aldolase [Verrucomicrobia bacterium]|nr:bifunctional 4-hydroxy-2-oxoglutarate aldolase/2-dehydro-3-deoxy-phosphogluconate aldolase [Verrucomicrobiota bacterium]
MSRLSRLEVCLRIQSSGLVPVFYHGDAGVVAEAVSACAEAGIEVFEFTNRGQGASKVFEKVVEVSARRWPGVVLGAGSIVDSETAALYAAHGAQFIVGPSFSERVARFCNRRKLLYVPGCATPTEIGTAEEWGAEIVKLFPCEAAGGPGFVKALLGPSPWTRIMATGVADASKDGITAWIKAGVCALGLGKELLRKEWIDAGDWSSVRARAEELKGWIQSARG